MRAGGEAAAAAVDAVVVVVVVVVAVGVRQACQKRVSLSGVEAKRAGDCFPGASSSSSVERVVVEEERDPLRADEGEVELKKVLRILEKA